MNRYLRLTLLAAICLPLHVLAEDAGILSQETTVIRHREEPLQWTPESVSVFTGDRLKETYLDSVEDLEAISPGLLVDASSGSPRGAAIWMRGVGSTESGAGFFPAVAVSVDGVYMGTPASQNLVLFDFDRIEVARGPQGTFQGAPAPGGTINLYRSKPTGELSARTRMTLGDFQRRRFDAVVNFPVIDKLAGKVSFNWRRGGKKLIQNLYTGRNENEEQLSAGSLSLLWRDKNFNIQYTYDGQVDKSDVPALLNLSSSSDLMCSLHPNNCSIDGDGLVSEKGGYSLTTQGYSNLRHYTVRQQTVHADTDLAGYKITSITAIRNTNETSYQDNDGTSLNFFSTFRRQHYRQVSEEINAYREVTPGFTYVVGAYLLNNSYTLSHSDLYALKVISDQGLILPVAPGAEHTSQVEKENRLRSLYGHVTYQLDRQWTLDIGARGTFVRTNFYNIVSKPNPLSGGFIVSPSILKGYTESAELTGTAGLTYKVDDNAMIYMRYSHDFRPGGFDDKANSAAAATPYDEERVDGYELGLKSEWFDNRVRLNYVAYRQDYKNKLERYTEATSAGSVESVLRNTADIRSFGHEAEIEAVPMNNLRLRASLSHSNTDYINYKIPDLTGTTDAIDLNDLIPNYSPPDQYQFSGTYSFPYAQGQVKLYAGYRFTTSYWSNSRVDAGHANTFAVMDFSVDYDWQDWKFRLFSKNINDRRYLTNATQTTEAEITPLPAGTTTDPVLMTTTEFNQPRFSGIEIIYNWQGRK